MPVVTLSAAELIITIFLLAGAVYVVWRMRRVTRGVIFRTWILALLSVGYVATFLLFGGATSRYLPDWVVALEIAIAIAVTGLTAWYSLHASTFTQDEKGRWIFQGRVVVLALWFGLFATRLIFEFVVVGTIYIVSRIPKPATLTATDITGIVIVEVLFAAATGVLLGGNIGIYLAYRKARRRSDELVPPPGASHELRALFDQ